MIPSDGEAVFDHSGTEALAEDRSKHYPKAEHRHRLALLLTRIGVEQGLRQPHQRRAEHALQQTEHLDLRQLLRPVSPNNRRIKPPALFAAVPVLNGLP